jgi:hypothetical protein
MILGTSRLLLGFCNKNFCELALFPCLGRGFWWKYEQGFSNF